MCTRETRSKAAASAAKLTGTLDNFIVRTNSLIDEGIALMERRVSRDLEVARRSSLGPLAHAPSPNSSQCIRLLDPSQSISENQPGSTSHTASEDHTPLLTPQVASLTSLIVHPNNPNEPDALLALKGLREGAIPKSSHCSKQNNTVLIPVLVEGGTPRDPNCLSGGLEVENDTVGFVLTSEDKTAEHRASHPLPLGIPDDTASTQSLENFLEDCSQVEQPDGEENERGIFMSSIATLMASLLAPLETRLKAIEDNLKALNLELKGKPIPFPVKTTGGQVLVGDIPSLPSLPAVGNVPAPLVRPAKILPAKTVNNSSNILPSKSTSLPLIGKVASTTAPKTPNTTDPKPPPAPPVGTKSSNTIDSKPPSAPPVGIKSRRNINLPPDAHPYVIVLTGVTELPPSSSEPFWALKNKVCYWLDRNYPLPPNTRSDMLMLERAPWVGQKTKNIQGDCIVVTFGDPRTVEFICAGSPCDTNSPIQVKSLSYFYMSHDQRSNRWSWLRAPNNSRWGSRESFRDHKANFWDGGEDRGWSTVRRRTGRYPQGASQFQGDWSGQQHYPPPLPCFNHFSSLEGVD